MASEDIKTFIKTSKERLQNILKRLNWTEDGVLKNFNTNSMTCERIEKPLEIVKPKIRTYPNSLPHSNSIMLETPQLQKLLADSTKEAAFNFDEYQRNFSREEKLKIYEYVIQNTQKLETPNDIEKRNHHELTFKEIVAKKRKEKSKKRRHRISKPTYLEEVRGLIDLQMQALQEYLGQEREHSIKLKISPKTTGKYDKRSRENASPESRQIKKPKQGERSSSRELYEREKISKRPDRNQRQYSPARKRSGNRLERNRGRCGPEFELEPSSHHHRRESKNKSKKVKNKHKHKKSRTHNKHAKTKHNKKHFNKYQ